MNFKKKGIKFFKKSKVLITTSLVLGTALTVGVIAGTSIEDSALNKAENHAILIESLNSNEITTYQNTIPTWARPVQVTVNGQTTNTYSISNMFTSEYDTYAEFEAAYRKSGNLQISRDNCDVILKEPLRTSNNCAFLTSLFYMNELNKSVETTAQQKKLFTQVGSVDWVINPNFFADDADDETSDQAYQLLNYSTLKSYGFNKEEVTAIPYQLAFAVGANGVLASDFNLSIFPGVAPNREVSLNLSYNPIVSYPATAPTNANYGTINISGTNLNSHSTNLPSIFGTAEVVSIRDNSLQSLNSTFVSSLTNVKDLTIGNIDNLDTNDNVIINLPTTFASIADTLTSFSSIKTGFTSNPIAAYANQLNVLETLNLSNNLITALGAIGSLSDTLKNLDVSSAGLTTIGTTLNSFTNLTSLSLANNSITTVTETTLGALTKLERLLLQGNSLTSLTGLKNLTKLKSLSLLNNVNLVVPASEFETLTSMERMNLSSTKIPAATLPYQKMKLIELHLDGLSLTETPLSLLAIPTLEWVSFANNNIEELRLSPYWKRVNYSNNKIQTIDPNSLPPMSDLVKPDNSFSYLPWSSNLQAIIFNTSTLDWTKMNDPRILKLQLPLFWDGNRIGRFYTTTSAGRLKFSLSNILQDKSVNQANLNDILITTLELERLVPTAQLELKNLNTLKKTLYTYDQINDSNLTYSFSKLYKGPENFKTIEEFTADIAKNVLNAHSNVTFVQESTKLTNVRNLKSVEQLNASQTQRSIVILIVVAVIIALLFTSGGLLFMLRKYRKETEVKGENNE